MLYGTVIMPGTKGPNSFFEEASVEKDTMAMVRPWKLQEALMPVTALSDVLVAARDNDSLVIRNLLLRIE